MNMADGKAWSIVALGDALPADRASFYDALAEDDNLEAHFALFGDDNERYYENPRLEVAILSENGVLVPAAKYPKPTKFAAKSVNVFLERYYVHAVPGSNFDLQLAISARHNFSGRGQERVSHTMAVKGVLEDYVNYLSEPVFQDLSIQEMLALDIAVTFVTDRSTESLLKVLKSPELTGGIKLASRYNPVFGTVATYVRGLVETVAKAKKNQAITDAHVGLLSDPGEISLPLISGTYVLFQPLSTADNIMEESPRFDSKEQRLVTDRGTFDRNHLFLRVQARG